MELGENESALKVLKQAGEYFPKSIRLKQLRALTLASMGQVDAARQTIAELYGAGHRDPGTLSVFARTWLDRYKESHKPIHLERARDLFAEALELAPHDCEISLNAAVTSVLLDDMDAAKSCLKEAVGQRGARKLLEDCGCRSASSH